MQTRSVFARSRKPVDATRIASWMSEISLRLATASDQAQLERLATLDGRRLPPAPLLTAHCDGELAAAVSLVTREVVADPFRRTLEIQQLLVCHAAGARIDAAASMALVAPRRSDRRPTPVGAA